MCKYQEINSDLAPICEYENELNINSRRTVILKINWINFGPQSVSLKINWNRGQNFPPKPQIHASASRRQNMTWICFPEAESACQRLESASRYAWNPGICFPEQKKNQKVMISLLIQFSVLWAQTLCCVFTDIPEKLWGHTHIWVRPDFCLSPWSPLSQYANWFSINFHSTHIHFRLILTVRELTFN